MAHHELELPTLSSEGRGSSHSISATDEKNGVETLDEKHDIHVNEVQRPAFVHEREPRFWDYAKAAAKPLFLLLVCAAFTVGQHFFNQWADGQEVTACVVPQAWVQRIITWFSFIFRSLVDFCMGFVLCQLVWFHVRRQFLTVKEIDQLYDFERRDLLPAALSPTVFKAPLLFIVAVGCLAFPFAAVLSSGSLGVETAYEMDMPDSCFAPVGDLSKAPMLYDATFGWWGDVSEEATRIALRSFVEGVIPPLPQPCGSNCSYLVSIDSMAFQCERNATIAQAQLSYTASSQTVWNATVNATGTGTGVVDPTSPFYVAWNSSSSDHSGTTGTAVCSPVLARYDFNVTTINGNQTITYNVTPTGDMVPVSNFSEEEALMTSSPSTYTQTLQVLSVAYAARALVLGDISVHTINKTNDAVTNSLVLSGSFLNTTPDASLGNAFVWGDVASGIESISHNITASLLTLNLGTQNTTCLYTRTKVLYTYSPRTLWLPYAIALGVMTIAVFVGIIILVWTNGHNLNTSFSHTVLLTRNSRLDNVLLHPEHGHSPEHELERTLLKFGHLPTGGIAYGTKQDFEGHHHHRHQTHV